MSRSSLLNIGKREVKPLQTKIQNRFRMIEVSKLVKAEWNYKKENAYIQSRLDNNINKNGQVQNIIVRQIGDDKYEVVNGNHRLTSLRTLGIEKALVCDIGNVSKELAVKIAFATNSIGFKNDPERLFSVIETILENEERERVIETTIYEDKDLTAILERIMSLEPQVREGEERDTILQHSSTIELKKDDAYEFRLCLDYLYVMLNTQTDEVVFNELLKRLEAMYVN